MMPLDMGGVETKRDQLVLWDPDVEKEFLEASSRIKSLIRQGFKLVDRNNIGGQAKLVPPKLNANMGLMRILSDNGDDRVVWDRTSKDQVKEAFVKFTDMLKRGYTAYACTSDGKRGHEVKDFNPGLQEVILVPATKPG